MVFSKSQLKAGLAVHSRQTAAAQCIDVGLRDLQNIIDDDHPILFPSVCEVKSPDGRTAVLVQYSRPRMTTTKQGFLAQDTQRVTRPAVERHNRGAI